MSDGHLEEKLDRRSCYLRTIKKLWIVPCAAAVLAAVFFLVYTAVIVTVSEQKQYTETSTFYLTFAFNENTQDYYDHYNAYTWQGLLFTHPGIYKTIEEELPEGMTLKEASDDTKADLISDIRVLTVDVTTKSTEDTAQLSRAIQDALVSFGETAEEFDRIEFLSATEPELVIVSDRSRNAALLGMVLGAVFSVLFLWLGEVLDDAVYTPEDIRRRYGLQVIAVTGKKEKKKVPAFLLKESKENLEALAGRCQPVPEEKERKKESFEKDMPRSESVVYLKGLTEETEESALRELEHIAPKDLHLVPAEGKEPDGLPVILVLVFGKKEGTRIEHLLYVLSDHGAKILGAVLIDADGAFLGRYYREDKDAVKKKRRS